MWKSEGSPSYTEDYDYDYEDDEEEEEEEEDRGASIERALEQYKELLHGGGGGRGDEEALLEEEKKRLEELQNDSLSCCLICLERIKRKQGIWQCTGSY